MKIIAFAGSNSSTSINKKLATYASSLFENSDVEVLDLNNYEAPLFSVDREKVIGQAKQAQEFLAKLKSADVLVVSLAENNGNYSTAFKNIMDWCSRIEKEIFQNKPMLLMATSPGGRGGKSVVEIAENNLPRYGGAIKAVFSLPSYNENFDENLNIITNQQLDEELKNKVKNLQADLLR